MTQERTTADLFHLELDSWPTAELIAAEWQITIEVKTEDKIYFLDLWEYKDMDLIMEAIDNARWKWIRRI